MLSDAEEKAMAGEDDEPEDEPEDEEENEDGEDTSKGLGSKKKLIIIFGATLLLVALIIGGLYISGVFNSSVNIEEKSLEENINEEQKLTETIVEKTSVEKKNVVKDGDSKELIITKGMFYHKFEELNVNLVSSIRKPKFLRLNLTVAVTQEADILVIEKLSPRVIGNVIQYLRGLKPKELEGSANFHRMHDNVLLRVRAAVAPVVVTDALITMALVK